MQNMDMDMVDDGKLLGKEADGRSLAFQRVIILFYPMTTVVTVEGISVRASNNRYQSVFSL
jgi:hypothetical protein